MKGVGRGSGLFLEELGNSSNKFIVVFDERLISSL
jgi:hypothetical protein